MGRLHIIVVRDPTFDFATQGNSALRAKTELQRPLDNRFRAGFDSDLIKPGVARFGESLDEIQSAAVPLFPIVEGQVPDLDRGHALIKILRFNGAGFERGDAHGDFECRSRWISGAKGPRQKWN